MYNFRVAYIVNQYPSVSHTFIRREIEALERCGTVVVRLSIRGWELPLVDGDDLNERQLTRYVLKGGAMPLLSSFLRIGLLRPRLMLGSFTLAFQRWKDSDRPLLVHLAYVIEACRVVQLLEADSVQHLHAHFCTNSAEVAMQCHQLGGPPYSFTAHGSDLMDKPTLMGLDLKISRAKFAVAVCSYGLSQIYRWIPHSDWKKVKVVRCGLEPGYGAIQFDRALETKNLVCVGRLSKEKGQLLLLEAIHLLKLNGHLIHLTLVGDGPMREELEELCKSYNLTESVEFTGWQDAEGVKRWILQSHALVLPSLSEGLPVVIMEAMALRRLVIAPYLAGIPELVSHRENGWLFPAGDIVSLAKAIELLMNTPQSQLSKMEDNAHLTVWKKHNLDLSTNNLLELFRENQG